VDFTVPQAQAIIDSDVPRILPKLLSDETYGFIRGWINDLMKLALAEGLTNCVTNLTNLVQAAKSFRSGGD
jgi:hypothetical protein